MKFSITVSGDTDNEHDMTALRTVYETIGDVAADDEISDETAPPAIVAPGEVDSAGLPWDARIHSTKRGKNGNGTWRYLKGVDKAIIPGVEAELRARSAAPLVASVPPPPQAGNAPVVSSVPPPSPAPVAAPSAPPPSVAPPAPPAAAADPNALTFAGFMAKYSAAQQAGKVHDGIAPWLFNECGITDFTGLATDPAKLAIADARMRDNGLYV